MLPEAFELPRPLVQWPNPFRVGSIKHLPAIAPHVDQTNIPQYAKVLRYGRLLQPEGHHNLPDRPLLQRKIIEYLAPAWLRNCVEGV